MNNERKMGCIVFNELNCWLLNLIIIKPFIAHKILHCLFCPCEYFNNIINYESAVISWEIELSHSLFSKTDGKAPVPIQQEGCWWPSLYASKEKIVLVLLNDFFPGEVLPQYQWERSLRDLRKKRKIPYSEVTLEDNSLNNQSIYCRSIGLSWMSQPATSFLLIERKCIIPEFNVKKKKKGGGGVGIPDGNWKRAGK